MRADARREVRATRDQRFVTAIVNPLELRETLDTSEEMLLKGMKSILIGRQGEAKALQYLVANGYVILGTHVYVKTRAGLRVTDILAILPEDGAVAIGIEVKGNGSVRTLRQRVKDELIETEGGELRSGRLLVPDPTEFSKGAHISYRTYILCVKFCIGPLHQRHDQ